MDNRADDKNTPTFAFEHVAAKLVPFDLSMVGARGVNFGQTVGPQAPGNQQGSFGCGIEPFGNTRDSRSTANKPGGNEAQRFHALWPIFMTNGLVFPYNPTITESVQVNYDRFDLTHTNESFNVYKNTENVRVTLSNAVWTCDTFDNAIYALSALHFFRTYSQMDFGKNRTGRPPSPMWFSAYGNYAFHRVPVLFEKADWSFPNDIDYVGIPEPLISKSASTNNNYTWLPMKFEVSNIALVVQHSPKYWTTYCLDDYRTGAMLRKRKSFHALDKGGSI